MLLDVEGHRCNAMIIPFIVVVTQHKPDMVIRDRSTPTPTVWLFELTIAFETNFEQAHTRKKVRYT